MAINANEDTEFNDALRKHGILPPLEPTPPSPSPPPSPTLSDALDDFTPAELQELADDAADEETERMIAAYRRQRLDEMKREERRGRFGRVYPIGREDYTREVTEASKVDEGEGDGEEKGTGVVCLLYKDGQPRSMRTMDHVRTLAERHPRTKFVSIVGDKCIPDLPESRQPMLIVYRRGDIIQQVVAWGADKDRRIEELEALLILCGAIVPPAKKPPRSSRADDSEDEDDLSDDPATRRPSGVAFANGRTPKNVRGPAKKSGDDSDSDFDL
ncbi:thioredoxin-like protein [Punctularia strigosozonata HHB-11173 SS5]|uniref:thioredoxin-like protein n=1 Tax=Punctularia strigosozonata (strain HHB-11173) TaxID=741275 RepID=UPI00044176C4|nr:thioredoxin-like protein [Punctularia strigosozonata HHB-11173 SS5]EIN07869.1 thioredoxin-like protein [Punctularia strigosozonata HHB-11173 SS5]